MSRRVSAAQARRELASLQESLAQLADVPRKVAIVAAPKIAELIEAEFETGADPYGRAWAPLAASTVARGRTPPPLTDTRDLRDRTTVTPRPGGRAGIQIKMGRAYGQFHQTGFKIHNARGKRAPKRAILPDHGMPASWRKAIVAAFAASTRATMAGRR